MRRKGTFKLVGYCFIVMVISLVWGTTTRAQSIKMKKTVWRANTCCPKAHRNGQFLDRIADGVEKRTSNIKTDASAIIPAEKRLTTRNKRVLSHFINK